MSSTLYLIFSFIQVGSLSLHAMILFGTNLLNMFKSVSLNIEICISISLLRTGFSQFTRPRGFCMLDASGFCNPMQGVGTVEDKDIEIKF